MGGGGGADASIDPRALETLGTPLHGPLFVQQPPTFGEREKPNTGRPRSRPIGAYRSRPTG